MAQCFAASLLCCLFASLSKSEPTPTSFVPSACTTPMELPPLKSSLALVEPIWGSPLSADVSLGQPMHGLTKEEIEDPDFELLLQAKREVRVCPGSLAATLGSRFPCFPPLP